MKQTSTQNPPEKPRRGGREEIAYLRAGRRAGTRIREPDPWPHHDQPQHQRAPSPLEASPLFVGGGLLILGFELTSLMGGERETAAYKVGCRERGGSGSRGARRAGRDVMPPTWANRSATRGIPSQSRWPLCWGRRGRPCSASDGRDGPPPRGAVGLVGVAWLAPSRGGLGLDR